MVSKCPNWLGGDFINRNSKGQVVLLQRDKDIPRVVVNLGGFGLVGSDAWLSQDIKDTRKLVARRVADLDDVRFALSALADRAEEVRKKRENGEPLTVAAVYPELARKMLGRETQVVCFTEGGLEGLPKVMPGLDGTFDLVESGQTAADNDLVIVEDNLLPVTLDAIWPSPNSSLVQSN